MRRALVVAAVTAVLSTPMAVAVADDTVVVPALAFPSSETHLARLGCADLYHADARAPQARVVRPDVAASGRRAVGFRLPGQGTAVGPVHRTDSVAATTVAGFTARAAGGSTGVAYVWYTAPDLRPGEVWAGRADLAVGPGWTAVDTRAVTYSWTKYAAATGAVLQDAGRATLSQFTGTHGDGPGYLLGGLGCDGAEFEIDALRFGAPGAVTTYDLEGIAASTTMHRSTGTLVEGDHATLSGATVNAAGVPIGASLVLQERPAGTDAFRVVGDPLMADRDGTVSVDVAPTVTTDYRWYYPESGLADESWSPVTRIVVEAARGRSR